jgi:processing peptidase subunit alpha
VLWVFATVRGCCTIVVGRYGAANDSQVGSVAILADAGCVFEPQDKRGICHMLDTLAFSGSAKFPAETLTGLMQTHGISAHASTSRDVLMLKAEAFRGSMPLAVSMMVDSVLQPTWNPEYVARARQTVSYQNEALNSDPARVISELMMEAAYGPGTALGTSQFASEEGAAKITEDDMRSFTKRMLRPDRMVLAGAGVDHDELVRMAEKELGHLRPYDPATDPEDEAPLPQPDTSYRGGLATQSVPLAEGQPGELLTHVSVVFPTMGWRDKREP